RGRSEDVCRETESALKHWRPMISVFPMFGRTGDPPLRNARLGHGRRERALRRPDATSGGRRRGGARSYAERAAPRRRGTGGTAGGTTRRRARPARQLRGEGEPPASRG